MPPNWEMCDTEDAGVFYYWNTATNETTWYRPHLLPDGTTYFAGALYESQPGEVPQNQIQSGHKSSQRGKKLGSLKGS
eukprot:16435670-Heterocapsa_arctica.AAC.1